MGKLIIYILIMFFAANTCFAYQLELSDVIQHAREKEILKISQSPCPNSAIKPIKNEGKTVQDTKKVNENTTTKQYPQQQINQNKSLY